MPLAAALIASGFMIMKPAPRKEVHEGSAVGRDLGGTLCPAEESTVSRRARPQPISRECDSARWRRHSGWDRDHLDHGLRSRQAPQALTHADEGPRRARPQRKCAVGGSLARSDAPY